jgi:hypothetical protein
MWRGSASANRVALPPEGDIRGLRTPAEGMTVARMVMIRCFCVSAFLRFCVSAFRRFGVSASRFLQIPVLGGSRQPWLRRCLF